jgi:hypothetical protein
VLDKFMKVFKTRWFARFARRERIADASLRNAIQRAERGLVDANLGGGLIKQRVARQGQGRSGGYRVIVAYRLRDRAIFFYGFSKSEMDNITKNQLSVAREFAVKWLALSDVQIRQAITDGELQEIKYDQEAEPIN